jgi:outer membrane protein assembly factor BamB
MKLKSLVCFSLLIAGNLMSPLFAEDFREWTMADGRKSPTKCKFVKVALGQVELVREDTGKIVKIRLDQLSKEDLAYVNQARAGAGAAAGTVVLGQWNQWRGPNRDGKSPDKKLLKEWPDAGPPLLWKYEGVGNGFSSIAISDGLIFTQGQKGGKCQLIAIQPDGAKEAWNLPFGEGEPNGAPSVSDGMVFAVDSKGNVVAANAKSGEEVWKANFGKDFGGSLMSGWGYSEGPLIDGDRIILTPGGENALMVALDKKTGKVIWKTKTPDLGSKGKPGAGYTGAVISNAAGTKQYVNLVGKAVIGVSADKGEVLWSYNAVNNDTANIPTPLVKDDYVFVSTGYGAGAALLQIKKAGKGLEAKEVYRLEASKFQNHHGGMIIEGDYLYAGTGHNNGFPICLEWKTGDIKWGEERHSKGKGSAAAVWADDHLVFRYQNGIVALIDASPKGYKELGSFTPVHNEREAWAHPVVLQGKLYLRSQNVLMCYDVQAR